MTVLVSADILRAIAPECLHPELVAPCLQKAMSEFEIDVDTFRVACFLAQVCVESQGFNRVRENLMFSTPERIRATWPTHYPTIQSAMPYVRQETMLANFVYANRMGNGSVQSGDGYRYRGGGFIQTTGRLNYSVTGSAIGIPLAQHPELIEEKPVAARSAGYFWKSHGLNEISDKLLNTSEDDVCLEQTKIINGGTTGLADRKSRLQRALSLFT